MSKLEQMLVALGYKKINIYDWVYEKDMAGIVITLPSTYVNPNPIENSYIYIKQKYINSYEDKFYFISQINALFEKMVKDVEVLENVK